MPRAERHVTVLVAALTMLAMLGCTSRGSSPSPGPMAANSYLHRVPPELPSNGVWINNDHSLRLADLRGQLVWLEFSFID